MSRMDNDRSYFKLKEAQRKKAPVDPNAWPEIPEDAPLMAGQTQPQARAQSAGPATITSQTTPAGSSEQDVRRSLRDKTALRGRVISAALTTADPGLREQLVARRREIESEIRPLGAALPQRMATPEGTQAGREHLRQELMRARQNSGATAPQDEMDPALQAGTNIAQGNRAMTTPMADPRDELRRQDILRVAARDSQLTGGSTDRYLTTPEMDERGRRRLRDQQVIAGRANERPVEEVFPDVTANEANQIQNRTEEVVARRAQDAAGAGEVLERDAVARAQARKLREGDATLVAERQSADIAQERARGAGTDTASVEQRARLAEAQGRLRVAQVAGQGAADEAERAAPTRDNMVVKDAVGRLEAMIPSIVEPGIGRVGYGGPEERDQVVAKTLADINQSLPNLTPAQKAEYANRVRPMLYQLMQDSSVFGRGDYREKYVQQLQTLLTSLES